MEQWNTGILGLFCIALKNIMIHEINQSWIEKTSTEDLKSLMIVTDQERHMKVSELPKSFQLPGHERLAKRGVVFENHQSASCVCSPSLSVLYTGQHIQNTGMFDNTNFPWSNDLSTDIIPLRNTTCQEPYDNCLLITMLNCSTLKVIRWK